MLRRGTRKRTASARAGVRRTPVVSKGVSSRASVQSSMTVTRPEAIYTSGHDGAAIPTTATVSTTRMLMPTFSSNQDNSVHIPDMLPWQPRRAIDLQPTVDNTQFVSQTGNVTNNDYVQIPNRIESVHENLGINSVITEEGILKYVKKRYQEAYSISESWSKKDPGGVEGVSSRASVQSSMTVTRPEAIYTNSGHDGAAIPTTSTVSTTRMLIPTFSAIRTTPSTFRTCYHGNQDEQ
ncbi:unnamed protein product [Mytilus edulis]|uniref:Uncharacterized protein n=1 Tax=Mytilus edulis TaxID=6550 RepID=A0A8S3RFG3_MYTED|nr:unnamed protein product [Mytilus edulis]